MHHKEPRLPGPGHRAGHMSGPFDGSRHDHRRLAGEQELLQRRPSAKRYEDDQVLKCKSFFSLKKEFIIVN